jgi:HEPN domain-containing protein
MSYLNSPLEHARALLARARDDLYVVRRLRTDPDAPGWVLGFHAQQAVENALKAVLSSAGTAYPRTHNLVMLAELLRPVAIPLPPDAEEFGSLVPFGVVLRYEDVAADEPPPIDPAWFDAVVTRTIDWASERLNKKQD